MFCHVVSFQSDPDMFGDYNTPRDSFLEFDSPCNPDSFARSSVATRQSGSPVLRFSGSPFLQLHFGPSAVNLTRHPENQTLGKLRDALLDFPELFRIRSSQSRLVKKSPGNKVSIFFVSGSKCGWFSPVRCSIPISTCEESVQFARSRPRPVQHIYSRSGSPVRSGSLAHYRSVGVRFLSRGQDSH